MRFDDRFETIMAMPDGDDAARTAKWCQLVDYVAQAGRALDGARMSVAMSWLGANRDAVSRTRRKAASSALAEQAIASPALLRLFGSDEPGIAAPVLRGARLAAEEWGDVLPALPVASRALLRERRDLPADTIIRLDAFGPADFALTDKRPERASADDGRNAGPIAIRDLVAKIEAYRAAHRSGEGAAPQPPMRFRFETRADGQIVRVLGVEPSMVIGLSIAELARAGDRGVDGQAAGAFRQRQPFAKARLCTGGDGRAVHWSISGKPLFRPEDGRFLGYRCIARQLPLEELAPATLPLLEEAIASDSVRQLVHELRTPLNAIRGFSEMIAEQMIGPAASEYRRRAVDIVDDARRLALIFDDLDLAARIDGGRYAADGEGPGDLFAAVEACRSGVSSLLEARAIRLTVSATDGNGVVAIGQGALQQLVGRVFGAVLGVSLAGDRVRCDICDRDAALHLEMDLPRRIAGLDQRELQSAMLMADAENPDGPGLGFGFSFRLIEKLAAAQNVALGITATRLTLDFPRAATVEAIRRERQ